jgi:Zn finger protein HypA/HybF involved in hydrogenase expression
MLPTSAGCILTKTAVLMSGRTPVMINYSTGAENNARRINLIRLRMGAYTEINPEILTHFIEEHAKGTIVEGAAIEITPSNTRELTLVSFECEQKDPS